MGRHCIRRGTFRIPYGTRSGSCYTGPKWQEHTENRENARDNCIARGYGLPTDHRLVWLPKSYGPVNTRGFNACDLSIRYFMPMSHEVLRQSTVRAKHLPVEITRHALWVRTMFRRILNCAGAVHPAAKDLAWTTSRYGLNDFVPTEVQLVVLLALTGRMSHSRVWPGKYNPNVHFLASSDPERRCPTDRTGIPKPARHPHGTVRFPQNWTYGYSNARMKSTGAPRMPAREPYGTCKVHVRYLATPGPKNMQITHRTPVCMWPQHRIMRVVPGCRMLWVVRAYDPWEVRVRNHPSSMCMVTCIRAFFGLSVFFVIVRTRTSTLRVPYGPRMGTVRVLADALWADEHPCANRP